MTNKEPGRINAVVLAGGINRIPLFEGCRPGYKAMLSLSGRPALLYTLEALIASGRIGHITIVGPTELIAPLIKKDPRLAECCDVVPAGDTLLGSLRAGLIAHENCDHILVTTADLPLLSPQAVFDFLDSSVAAKTIHLHNVYLSVVPSQAFAGPYSSADKMFSRFRDVAVCQGNLGLVDPWILTDPDTLSKIDRVYAARKGRFSSAMAFGWRVGLSYVFGVALLPLLTMNQLAAIVSRRFGFGIIPILCHHPGIATDIDEPADYVFVCGQLGAEMRENVEC